MASTCRATAARATIRFLKNQYLARDGIEHQFFSGCLEFSATESKPLASLCFSRSRAGVHSSIRRSRKAAGQCLFVRLAAFIPIYPNNLPTVPKPSRASRTASLVFTNLPASQSAITRLLNRSIEGEVKRKYFSHRWSFSCFQPHVLEQRRFRPAVPFAQTLNMSAQRIRLFLSAVFIASFATKPVRSETHKQNGCQWQP